MNTSELAEKLAAHKDWLADIKFGEKLCLSGADLRNADLRNADLRKADLSGVNLRGADLNGTCFRRTDLSGVNLRGAKSFVLLPVQDMRGYSFAHAVLCDDQWRVRVGCRDFTIDEALAHWGDSYEGDRGQGDMYLYAVNWLQAKVETQVAERETVFTSKSKT